MSLCSVLKGRGRLMVGLAAVAMLVLAACGGGEGKTLTVYSGRSKTLVQPVLDAFARETGIKVGVKYASSAGIVATILEEGKNSPADVVFLQGRGRPGRPLRGRGPGAPAGRRPGPGGPAVSLAHRRMGRRFRTGPHRGL